LTQVRVPMCVHLDMKHLANRCTAQLAANVLPEAYMLVTCYSLKRTFLV